MPDTPRLRGHHLICLHFFSGRGYNREFVENLKRTLKAAEKFGAEIVYGADDICIKCPYLKRGKCLQDEHSNKEIMEMDEFALHLLREISGNQLKWNSIKERIPRIFSLWMNKYCKKCSWKGVCEEDAFYREFKDGKCRA